MRPMRRFHADDRAGQRAGQAVQRRVARLERQLDLLAAHLVQDLPERRIGAQVDREALERLLDRLLAVVAQRHRLALARPGRPGS